jgi:hypothetical protein
MIKHIKIWKMILLTFVTFGIYNTVWYARRRNEMVKNYNVSIPHWWWLVTPSLLSLAIISIFVFIYAIDPSPAAFVVMLVPLVSAPFVVWGFYLWWLWHFGKAAEKVTQGRVTLVWMVIYIFLLGGYIQYVLQYYFNRLPKIPTTKRYEPSKRFVKYSVIAIIVLQVLSVGAGIAINILNIRSQAPWANQDPRYLESVKLMHNYDTCLDKLNADFPGEITEGAEEKAYNKGYAACDEIRVRQNAAADAYNSAGE